MKNNKKGFAFSTMLYGTTAVIAIILFIILNINKESKDMTYYYGEEILKDLNECVEEEILLENCYTSGANNCSAVSYHACLGISDNTSSYNGLIISEKLKENLVDEGEGLYLDEYVNNRYLYRGLNVNNYLQYSGKLWRILSIENGGFIKIIDIDSNLELAWNSDIESNIEKNEWNNGTLYNYLNNNYLPTLNDNSSLYDGKWNKLYLYRSGIDGNYSITDLIDQETHDDTNSTFYNKVGIISIGDYAKASLIPTCHENVLDNSCQSWLNNYKGWTIDINAEESDKAYYQDYIDSKYIISEDNLSSIHNVYPIIYLSRNAVILSGDGTEANPYIVR